jgi:HlyD family secretion protein
MALSRKSKIIIGASAGVLLLVVIVATIFATRKDTPEVTVVKVTSRPELRSTVTSSGEVRPVQYMNLTSEVQGRIEEIYVKEGDVVKKGQPLVRIDPTQLETNAQAQLAAFQSAQDEIRISESQLSQAQQQLNTAQVAVDSARQGVEAAQTDVDREQNNLAIARREYQRTSKLLESGVVSRLQYDEAKDKVDQAEIALRNAQSRLKSQTLAVKDATARLNQQSAAVKTATLSINSSQARASQQSAILRGQRNQRDKSLVVAPINGVIAEIPSKVGTFAVAGLSTTALLTIADMSSINVEVKVDETEIDKVLEGQRAKIKVDAFGDREIIGEVANKTPLAVGKSQTSGGLSTNINVQEAKEFKVVIRLKDLPQDLQDGLRPGMSATAEITTRTVNNVIAVPLQAVIEKKPDASPSPVVQGEAPQPVEKPKPIKGVYVLDGNKAKFVEVQTGITGESDIEITSGLQPDQEVITGPSRVLNTLKEGTVVKKQEKKEGDNSNRS